MDSDLLPILLSIFAGALVLFAIVVPLWRFFSGFMEGYRGEQAGLDRKTQKKKLKAENESPKISEHKQALGKASNNIRNERTISPKVFMCYRRDDTADVVGRVYDQLIEKYGVQNVYKDVDSAPLGRDFREAVEKSISSCDACLVFIGRNWLDEKSDGKRRIDESTDLVKFEIETALTRNIPVIPVLVRGSDMPNENSLPKEIGALAYRHGVPVRSDPDFHTDVDRLIRGLQVTIEDTSLS